MLLGRVCLHLIFRHFQCLNQTFASLSRINDFVNISQLGSLIRSSKLFFVGFQFLGLCCFVSFAEQDIDGAVRTHYSNFCTWVSEVHVSSGLLGVHYDISTTVSFAGNHCQFGNSSFCKCINYFCTVTDDTIVFLVYIPEGIPGTSSNVINGILKQSQKRIKRLALSLASISRTPAR